MARKRILVCTGKRCRKALEKDGRLEKVVERLPVDVTRVGCQKVCRGPVVGIAVDGQWQWFGRMDSRKALDALINLVEHDAIGKPLRKRRDEKRAAKRRR